MQAIFDKLWKATHLANICVGEECMGNGEQKDKRSIKSLANDCREMEEMQW
jgi:hypothetical protein